MRCPCEKCPDKGCGPFHDDCEAYQTFARWRAEKLEDKQSDLDYRCYRKKTSDKWMRRECQ